MDDEATGPGGDDETSPAGNGGPKLTLTQRILTALPNLQRDAGATGSRATARPSTGERKDAADKDVAAGSAGGAKRDNAASSKTSTTSPRPGRFLDAFLKPPAGQSGAKSGARGGAKADPTADMSNEELTHAIKRIDDRERLYALFAGPLGAAIGIVLTVAAIHSNPAVGHKGHEAASVIAGFGAARIVLGALVVIAALTRRRSLVGFSLLFLGTAVGFPFALLFWGLGAWMIWRVFRYQKVLTARGAGPQRGRGAGAQRGRGATSQRGRGAQAPRTAARSGSTDARERLRQRREAKAQRRGKQPVPTGPPASKRYTPPKPTRPRPPAASS